ncbi:MAG: hypothetical protein ABIJ09_07025 [Pseudomonadota bacterium]
MPRIALVVLSISGWVCACPGPDCLAICDHSLACDVTFTPADDPNLRKIESGERTDRESCELGCRESLSVDAASEACILGVEAREPEQCRAELQTCLGWVDSGN